jgi:hypothetical protein
VSSWIYRADQDSPSYAVAWSDRDGTLINFSSGYTFEVKLVNRVDGTIGLTKSAGITGAAVSPNITVAWTTGELAAVPPAAYRVHLTATTGGADRMFRPGDEPIITIVAAT